MPLASTGALSLGGTTASRSVNLELGRASTAQISMGETAVRTLAGVASGAISFNNFYGKSATVSELLYSFNVTGNVQSFTAENATIAVDGAVTGTQLEATSFTDIFNNVSETNNFTGSWRWVFPNAVSLMRATGQTIRNNREVTLVANLRRRAGTGTISVDYGDGVAGFIFATSLPLNTFTVVSVPVIAGTENFIDFPGDGNYTGWDIDVDYIQANVTGALTISSSGIDPILRSPVISLSGTTYRYITIRLRRTAGTGWQGDVYYTTASHGESELYKKSFTEPSWDSGLYQIIVLDMSDLTAGGTDWSSSTITRVRFDLGASAADVFQIDYIRLSSTP
jgi:hypothetical protein